MHYYTKQDDIAVGTDIANRNFPETENIIGFFVNQLVLRTYLGAIQLSGIINVFVR
jgi:non-ribosomal peptide synthetase component F